jgi:hypothetical protein
MHSPDRNGSPELKKLIFPAEKERPKKLLSGLGKIAFLMRTTSE